jgi:hypothetical protein
MSRRNTQQSIQLVAAARSAGGRFGPTDKRLELVLALLADVFIDRHMFTPYLEALIYPGMGGRMHRALPSSSTTSAVGQKQRSVFSAPAPVFDPEGRAEKEEWFLDDL